MGGVVYDDTREIAADDRVVARLQVDVIDKLRDDGSFGLKPSLHCGARRVSRSPDPKWSRTCA